MKLDLRSTPMQWILAACLGGSFLVYSARAQDTRQQEAQEPPAPQAQPEKAQPSHSQARDSQQHDAQEEVQIEEHTRTYVVHLPQGYDSQQHYPVVILLHGRDQDAPEP